MSNVFGASLPRFPERRPLNGCLSVFSLCKFVHCVNHYVVVTNRTDDGSRKAMLQENQVLLSHMDGNASTTELQLAKKYNP